jgi:hypothetical protein
VGHICPAGHERVKLFFCDLFSTLVLSENI